MSIELCILASGSTGNCTVLRTPAGIVLIDAGIGPRVAAQRLEGTGVTLADIAAICLTHLDRDHLTTSWFNTCIARQIRLHCHRSRVDDLLRVVSYTDPPPDKLARFQSLIESFDGKPFEPVPGLHMRPIHLAHDQTGSHGFLIECHGCRAGYATDLGRVPDALLEHFDDLDLLALEANYDPDMQLNSARPWFLKQRIMGGHGHLSNDQALVAVKTILNRSKSRRRRLPNHIVLLHRSQQCNCPRLVRRLFSQDPRIAPRLTLAEPYERSPWLRAAGIKPFVGEQLALSFS
jgi:phosphoribosyl 1,2-cyclic phosphodiesterase